MPYVMFMFWCLALFARPGGAYAEDAPLVQQRGLTVTAGTRVWISTGGSHFNIAAPSGSPNVLSELKWKKMSSTVAELHTSAVLHDMLIFNVAGGYGSLSGGNLRDVDYDGDNRTLVQSDTTSTANDGHLFFVQADVGLRLATWRFERARGKSFVNGVIGYQHWSEKYVAGATTDNLNGGGDSSTPSLTETFAWDSLRLGVQTRLEVLPDLAVSFNGYFVPVAHLTLTDIHHLRTTGSDALRQDPSFRGTGTGYGGQIDATVMYRVWRGLSLEAGYQWWYLRATNGTDIARPATGPEVAEPLNVAVTQRYGVIVGVRYEFDFRSPNGEAPSPLPRFRRGDAWTP